MARNVKMLDLFTNAFLKGGKMKKLNCLFYFLFTILFCAYISTLSYAENILIYGCYQKNHGQLRVVDSWSECLTSEVPITWVAQSNNIVDYLLIYVNASTGFDDIGYGLSKDKPFKTSTNISLPQYKSTVSTIEKPKLDL